MPRCERCAHDFATHVKFGPVIGIYSCRSEGCRCTAYVARTRRIAAAAAQDQRHERAS